MTVAPATPVPSFSLTLPLIEDVVTCASTLPATNMLKTVKANNLIVFFIKIKI